MILPLKWETENSFKIILQDSFENQSSSYKYPHKMRCQQRSFQFIKVFHLLHLDYKNVLVFERL